ncbi:MAG: TIGR01777 family oxidoreductase [Deltaproteobacteria bacterium]|nr:TIGR01777 family oxidoreductase [Deltaproteobacteria bacterium]
MKIFITGGTGFIGQTLVNKLKEAGHELSLLSRSVHGSRSFGEKVRWIEGDPTWPGAWQEEAARSEAIINLAGASIFSRWNEQGKQKILESRVSTTRHLAEAVAGSTQPPQAFLNASAVGYYGFRNDEEIDETGTPGDDFLARVCQAWEAETLQVTAAGSRVALMRFGIVLGRRGGALNQMLPLFRLGLGGRLGKGTQWFSWIHLTDLVRSISFILNHPEAHGPINLTAPNPVTNTELTRVLGRVLHRPAVLPVPSFMIKMVLGEFGSVLLQGQRVQPVKLQSLGFDFRFSFIDQALKDLLG